MVLSYQALLIRQPILIPLVADIMSLYSIYYFLQGYNKNEFQLKSTPEYCNCMDSYSDLGFFVLLARHATLARAAQELGVTPSTVSKRLAALEQRLGVRLMNRTTRRISFTVEGESYLAQGNHLLNELKMLEQTLVDSRATPRGLLRVHATLG